jgi:hypothetical protein
MRSSTPHTSQRYRTLIRRISPGGGGGGSGRVTARNNATPIFHNTTAATTPIATQITVANAGTLATLTPLLDIPS